MKKFTFSWPLRNSVLDEYGIYEEDDKGRWILVGKEYVEKENEPQS